jgi:sulfocyanin
VSPAAAPAPANVPMPPPADTAAGPADGAATATTPTAVPAGAPEAGQVDWMRVDEAGKKVEMDIVAGLTGENGAWNFNGHAKGEMTITVPVGWTVVMNFTSHDANVPHSLYVTDQAPPYPSVMPGQPAISRAYSINLPQGIGPGKSDVLRFTVDKPGDYYLVCGVPGHAASGMWDYFRVSAEARRPSVELKKK